MIYRYLPSGLSVPSFGSACLIDWLSRMTFDQAELPAK